MGWNILKVRVEPSLVLSSNLGYLLSIGRAQRTATRRLHTITGTLGGHPTPRSANGEGAHP